jgi:hypothetical protein
MGKELVVTSVSGDGVICDSCGDLAVKDYGRTKLDDHAKTGLRKAWVVTRWFLWMIGLITLSAVIALAGGVWAIAT